MELAIIFQGMAVGLSIAAPVGAIGLLCIQNTITYGMAYGFACGLGAATADMMYGILVAVGMQTLATVLVSLQIPLSLLGGIFLFYLGLQKFWAKPAVHAASISSTAFFGAYFSTFLLTLTNPATILDFMALFIGLRVNIADHQEAFGFVGGVFMGSAAWWLLLSGLVGVFRSHVSLRILKLINYLAGIMICGFGLWALYQALSLIALSI